MPAGGYLSWIRVPSLPFPQDDCIPGGPLQKRRDVCQQNRGRGQKSVSLRSTLCTSYSDTRSLLCPECDLGGEGQSCHPYVIREKPWAETGHGRPAQVVLPGGWGYPDPSPDCELPGDLLLSQMHPPTLPPPHAEELKRGWEPA